MKTISDENWIKKDEKLFIIRKINDFFYYKLGVDERANFFGNNLETEEASISIRIGTNIIDKDELFIRFGSLWNKDNHKEIIVEHMEFKKGRCSFESAMEILKILHKIAQKFNYQKIRFVQKNSFSEAITLEIVSGKKMIISI